MNKVIPTINTGNQEIPVTYENKEKIRQFLEQSQNINTEIKQKIEKMLEQAEIEHISEKILKKVETKQLKSENNYNIFRHEAFQIIQHVNVNEERAKEGLNDFLNQRILWIDDVFYAEMDIGVLNKRKWGAEELKARRLVPQIWAAELKEGQEIYNKGVFLAVFKYYKKRSLLAVPKLIIQNITEQKGECDAKKIEVFLQNLEEYCWKKGLSKMQNGMSGENKVRCIKNQINPLFINIGEEDPLISEQNFPEEVINTAEAQIINQLKGDEEAFEDISLEEVIQIYAKRVEVIKKNIDLPIVQLQLIKIAKDIQAEITPPALVDMDEEKYENLKNEWIETIEKVLPFTNNVLRPLIHNKEWFDKSFRSILWRPEKKKITNTIFHFLQKPILSATGLIPSQAFAKNMQDFRNDVTRLELGDANIDIIGQSENFLQDFYKNNPKTNAWEKDRNLFSLFAKHYKNGVKAEQNNTSLYPKTALLVQENYGTEALKEFQTEVFSHLFISDRVFALFVSCFKGSGNKKEKFQLLQNIFEAKTAVPAWNQLTFKQQLHPIVLSARLMAEKAKRRKHIKEIDAKAPKIMKPCIEFYKKFNSQHAKKPLEEKKQIIHHFLEEIIKTSDIAEITNGKELYLAHAKCKILEFSAIMHKIGFEEKIPNMFLLVKQTYNELLEDNKELSTKTERQSHDYLRKRIRKCRENIKLIAENAAKTDIAFTFIQGMFELQQTEAKYASLEPDNEYRILSSFFLAEVFEKLLQNLPYFAEVPEYLAFFLDIREKRGNKRFVAVIKTIFTANKNSWEVSKNYQLYLNESEVKAYKKHKELMKSHQFLPLFLQKLTASAITNKFDVLKTILSPTSANYNPNNLWQGFSDEQIKALIHFATTVEPFSWELCKLYVKIKPKNREAFLTSFEIIKKHLKTTGYVSLLQNMPPEINFSDSPEVNKQILLHILFQLTPPNYTTTQNAQKYLENNVNVALAKHMQKQFTPKKHPEWFNEQNEIQYVRKDLKQRNYILKTPEDAEKYDEYWEKVNQYVKNLPEYYLKDKENPLNELFNLGSDKSMYMLGLGVKPKKMAKRIEKLMLEITDFTEFLPKWGHFTGYNRLAVFYNKITGDRLFEAYRTLYAMLGFGDLADEIDAKPLLKQKIKEWALKNAPVTAEYRTIVKKIKQAVYQKDKPEQITQKTMQNLAGIWDLFPKKLPPKLNIADVKQIMPYFDLAASHAFMPDDCFVDAITHADFAQNLTQSFVKKHPAQSQNAKKFVDWAILQFKGIAKQIKIKHSDDPFSKYQLFDNDKNILETQMAKANKITGLTEKQIDDMIEKPLKSIQKNLKKAMDLFEEEIIENDGSELYLGFSFNENNVLGGANGDICTWNSEFLSCAKAKNCGFIPITVEGKSIVNEGYVHFKEKVTFKGDKTEYILCSINPTDRFVDKFGSKMLLDQIIQLFQKSYAGKHRKLIISTKDGNATNCTKFFHYLQAEFTQTIQELPEEVCINPEKNSYSMKNVFVLTEIK